MQNDQLFISSWARIASNENGRVRLVAKRSSLSVVEASRIEKGVRIEDEVVSIVEQSLTELYRKLNIDHPKFFKMDDQSKLGFLGSYILLDEMRAKLKVDDEAVAMLFANSSSSLNTDRQYQETVGHEGTGSPAKFVYTLPNIVIGEVCIYWKQHGETQFLVLPKFDPEILLKHAEIMFAASDCKHVLLGWTEVGHHQTDGLFILLTKNEGLLATVNDLYQLYNR